jgi:hypothetical protein
VSDRQVLAGPCRNEVVEMAKKLVVLLVMISSYDRILDRLIYPFDLSGIRYEICRRLTLRLFPEREIAIW